MSSPNSSKSDARFRISGIAVAVMNRGISSALPFIITAVLTARLLSRTSAERNYAAIIPNGASMEETMERKLMVANSFDDAHAKAGYMWSKELCMADSDGYHQTNGQELGDPCCQWSSTSNPVVLWTSGVSHPGNASITSDPSMWTDINCSASAATGAASSPSESVKTLEETSSQFQNHARLLFSHG